MFGPIYYIDSIAYTKTSVGPTFRKNGPCVIFDDGAVFFSQLQPDSYNRTAGPSKIDPSGYIRYYNAGGYYHRTDGPAVIKANGQKEYWIKHVQLTPEEFFLKYGVL